MTDVRYYLLVAFTNSGIIVVDNSRRITKCEREI